MTLQYIDGATVTVKGSDGAEYQTTTDIRGYYSFDKTKILPEVTYDIHVKKSGYYDNENCRGRETTVGLLENKDLKHNFILNPIPKEPVLLPEILYDLARWELKPQYQDSLMGLYKIMKENPTFVIELRSHTDVRPIPMTNDTLSQRRAESCVNFLIDSMHIDPARLVAKGYAERVPRTLERDIVSRGYVAGLDPAWGILRDNAVFGIIAQQGAQPAPQSGPILFFCCHLSSLFPCVRKSPAASAGFPWPGSGN